MQDDAGANDSDDGCKENVETGFDGAEVFDRRIPGDKTERRSAQPQKEQIQHIDRIGKAFRRKLKIKERAGWQHEAEPVEKGAARRLNRCVAKTGDFAREDRVKAPDQCRQQRQNVAFGIEGKTGAAEADETDSHHGDEKTNEKICRKPFFAAQKKMRQHRCEERRHCHDHADV